LATIWANPHKSREKRQNREKFDQKSK
jgi:hypothetical protein